MHEQAPWNTRWGHVKAAAIAYTLTETAKLESVDPQAWLTWVLARIGDQKITRLDDFMPSRYAVTAARLANQPRRRSTFTERSPWRWLFVTLLDGSGEHWSP